MDSTKHLIAAITLSTIIILVGTAGYMIIEKWSLLDSLYMTIITLTTVGYSETHALSPGARIFTIILIMSGFGFFVYVAGAVVQFMVEGQIRQILGRRRLDRKINRLKNHYIVCGYGRIGRVLCKKLRGRPLGLVVVEANPAMAPEMEKDGALYILGDAANDASLLKARVTEAAGLIAALGTDADNVFLVLTARQLNPNLNIIARAGERESESKLRAAGANRVESPYEIGAASMAQRILRPTVTNFLDLALSDQPTDIQMEEIPVSAASHLVGVMLKDSGIRQRYNLIIIAIKKPDGTMQFNPSYEATLNIGDTVVAVGRDSNLQLLEKILNPCPPEGRGGRGRPEKEEE